MTLIKVNNQFDSAQPVGISDLGTIVFDNVLFPAGTYIDRDGNAQEYDEVKLDAVTIDVNRRKRIVKSQVSGRDGDIKEYVSAGDYMINLNAIITPPTINTADIVQATAGAAPGLQAIAAAGSFTVPNNPDELLLKIARLEQIPDRIPIRCKHLQNNYNITYVVIEDFREKKLTADTWTIQFMLTSDFDTDLKDFG